MASAPSAHPLLHWWRDHVVVSVEHVSVMEHVRDDTGWTGRYVFTLLMSAGIAVLGLLLSSPAVVIGAMLISPLMGPIIGLGFALATFDLTELRRAALALAGGTAVAVLFCAAIVMLSPLQNVTSEIAARTRPNLFDLMIALFSALAGAYATIRGRAGTVVGVAIATALMPPLAVVGFGLATLNGTVAGGAALLFFTNFMTITLAAAVMARLYGFGPRLSPQQTVVQSLVLIGLFVALAVPLGLALRQVAWEALASRQARDVLSAEFGGDARLSQVEIDYDAMPITVTATVFTPTFHGGADRRAAATLKRLLRRDIAVRLEQYRVGTGQIDSKVSQGGAAAPTVPARAIDDRVAERLALIAGVAPDAVTVDPARHRALVRAAPLPGATLATYRTLEARVAAASRDWDIALIPPPLEPPAVSFDGDAPDAAGQAAIADAAWGAARRGLGVEVIGSAARTRPVVDALVAAKVDAAATARGGAAVTLRWRTGETTR